MVLSLDAHPANAAVEGARWSHDHASRAHAQIVSLFVRVDDTRMFEAIVGEVVGVFITIVRSLRLCLVLNVDALSRSLAPDRVTILAGDGWADARLSVRALVNQPE